MSDAISWTWALPGAFAAAVGVGAAARGPGRISTKLVGAAVWAGSVALKLAWAVPTNAVVHRAITGVVGERFGEPLYWLYIGLLTGIFEVGATLAVVRFTRLRRAGREEALAFGVGFGSVEAVAVGALAIVPVILMIAAPGVLPTETRAALAHAYAGSASWTSLLFSPLERATALVVHVATCTMVIHGFRVRRPGAWFAGAFACKSLVDTAAAWAISGGRSGSKIAVLEVGLAVLALGALWLLRDVHSRKPAHV